MEFPKRKATAKHIASDRRNEPLRTGPKRRGKAKAGHESLTRLQVGMLLDDRDTARFASLRRRVGRILKLPAASDQSAQMVDWWVAEHLNRKRLVTINRPLANNEFSPPYLLALLKKFNRFDMTKAAIASQLLENLISTEAHKTPIL